MPARAAAPGNDAPGSEDPALIKMSNQHAKLGQARSKEPAPTKLNEQDNTHAVPVRALMAPAQSPMPRRAGRSVHRETVLGSYSRGLPVTRETALLTYTPGLPHHSLRCAGLSYATMC